MKLLNISVAVATLATMALFTGCDESPRPEAPIYVKPKPVGMVSVTGSAEALKRLTVAGPHERVLSLSPDNQWLLLETYKHSKDNRVVQKMRLSNGVKMLLTPDSSSNKHAVWHPNQKSFVFATNRMRNFSIVQSMGVSGGSGAKFITKSSLGDATYPDISSDGKQVVFSVDGMLSMIEPNGMNLIMFGAGYRPKFSPDNKHIVYAQKVGKYRHLYTMRTDGQEVVQLTSERVKDYGANWSPSGKKLAFVSNRVGKHRHLFVMDIDGSNITQMTNGSFNVNSIEWGGDGYIYFSSDAGGNEDVWRLKPKL